MDKKDDDYSRIPVFAFPSPIIFHANERESCKQILTIYNPYDFPIRFKILSTAPSNYTVIDSEGSVKAKNSVDLIVRLTSSFTSEAQSHVEDKFRVQIYNYDTRQLLGRKDVPSVVQFGNSSFPSSSGASYAAGPSSSSHHGYGSSESLHGGLSGTKNSPSELQFLPPGGGGGGNSMFYGGRGDPHHSGHPNYIAVLTALVCIVGLLLPTHNGDAAGATAGRSGDSTTSSYLYSLPAYFHLSINQKLLIAYTLGLVTMVIFRPQ